MNMISVRDFLREEAHKARNATVSRCPEHNETNELLWRARVYDKLANVCTEFGVSAAQADMIREAIEVFSKDTWGRAMLRGETVSVLALAADICAVRDF